MWGRALGVIDCAKFRLDRFMGFGAPGGRKSLSPIDWRYRSYNSVRINVLHCDTERDLIKQFQRHFHVLTAGTIFIEAALLALHGAIHSQWCTPILDCYEAKSILLFLNNLQPILLATKYCNDRVSHCMASTHDRAQCFDLQTGRHEICKNSHAGNLEVTYLI